MKKKILLFLLLFLLFTTATQANNTLQITIESSFVHQNEETVIKNFSLSGILIKNFIEDEKTIILSNGESTIIEKIGDKFVFKDIEFATEEREDGIYLYSYKNRNLFKKLDQNF